MYVRLLYYLLGIAEIACNWIAHKVSKIPHTKKNTDDSSAIYSLNRMLARGQHIILLPLPLSGHVKKLFFIIWH